jgi:hypothetical protein
VYNIATETIDGLEVTTQQMAPMAAAGMNFRLLRLLEPVLKNLGDVEIGEDLGFAEVAPAIAGFFGGLDEVTGTKLIRDILATTTVIGADDDGNRKKFDLSKGDAQINGAFQGPDGIKLMSLYATVWFAIRVCFRDFIDAVSAKIAVALASAKAALAAKESPPS